MLLSLYLLIITINSLLKKSVTREERGEGLTFENLAILKLKPKEKIQGALGVVTALASMYLFSILGVEGDPSITIWVVGGVGTITIGEISGETLMMDEPP